MCFPFSCVMFLYHHTRTHSRAICIKKIASTQTFDAIIWGFLSVGVQKRCDNTFSTSFYFQFLFFHHHHHIKMSRSRAAEETDKQTRIAIVSTDKCKPKRCRQECKKSCPVVRMGKLCIEVAPDSKIATLSEELCIGCGICVKVKPLSYETSGQLKFLLFRNAPLKPLQSSMSRVTWTNIRRIGIRRIPSNCIVYQCRDRVKS